MRDLIRFLRHWTFASNAIVSLLVTISISLWRLLSAPHDDSGGTLVGAAALAMFDFLWILLILEVIRWLGKLRKGSDTTVQRRPRV